MTTSMLSEYDELVAQMLAMKIPLDKAEAAARLELGIKPKTELEQLRDEALVAQLEDEVLEDSDRLMQALGFVPIRLAQKRASKVTAGVPDRYYIHTVRKLALWYEAKTATGRARPAQLQFRQLCLDAGIHHVLGGFDALRTWLTDHQVATFDESGLPQPVQQ